MYNGWTDLWTLNAAATQCEIKSCSLVTYSSGSCTGTAAASNRISFEINSSPWKVMIDTGVVAGWGPELFCYKCTFGGTNVLDTQSHSVELPNWSVTVTA